MIIIYGTGHFFKKRRVEELDWCDHCRGRMRLASYTAWRFFTVYWIVPLIPLGSARCVRFCPHCKHYVQFGRRQLRQTIQEVTESGRQAAAAGNAQAAAGAALMLVRLGAFEAADDILDGLEPRPGDAGVHSARGTAHAMKRQHRAAEECFRLGIMADPSSAEAHFLLGEVLVEMRRSQEGIDEMRRAAELAPEAMDVRVVLMTELERKRDWPGLVTVMEEMARLDPSRLDHKPFAKLLKKARGKAGLAVMGEG